MEALLPEELWKMIIDLSLATKDLLVFRKTCALWKSQAKNLFKRAVADSLLPYLVPYLAKNYLLRCSLVCKQWRELVANAVENGFKGEENENLALTLPPHLLPVVVLNGENSRKTIRRLTELSTTLRTQRGSTVSSALLGRSLSLAIVPDFETGSDFDVERMVEAFLQRHGSLIWNLQLKIRQSDVSRMRRSFRGFLSLTPNLHRLQIIAELFCAHRHVPLEQDSLVAYPEPFPIVPQLPEYEANVVKHLPFLRALKLDTEFVGNDVLGRPSSLGSFFLKMFLHQFQQLGSLTTIERRFSGCIQFGQISNLTELDILVRGTDSLTHLGRLNSGLLRFIRKLTLRFLWDHRFKKRLDAITPEEQMRLYSQMTNVRQTLSELHLVFHPSHSIRQGLFPASHFILPWKRLQTLVVTNGVFSSDFGGLKSLKSLQRIHIIVEEQNLTPFEDVIGTEQSGAIVWRCLPRLREFIVQERGKPWHYSSRHLNDFFEEKVTFYNMCTDK